MDYLSGEAEFSLSDGVPNSSDPPEISPSLLRETNQSFEDWLTELRKSQPADFDPAAYSAALREINFEGTLRVDGYMAGVICSDAGTLILDQNGEIDGDIVVPVAIIRGRVRGDIRASERVELEPAARVIGDIETLEILVHPGASFEGRVQFPESAAVDPEPAAEDPAFANTNQPEASFAAAG
jgi:cytoskeletal protein CcmA (bactofilin family)